MADRGIAGEAHSAPGLAQTSVQLLPANQSRNYLCLCNDSAVVVYVSIDGSAAAQNKGIRLAAGEKIIFDTYVPSKAIFATSASGSGNKVLVTEG